MSNGADAYVDIVARLQSQEAEAGADRVVDAVDKVERKTKEASEGMDLAAAANIRSLHHVLMGFRELGEGGIPAIGGVAAELRYLTEVEEEALGALAPVALLLTTATMLAAPMIAKLGESKDATKENKEASDEWKESMERASDTAKALLEIQTEALNNYLEGQKASLDYWKQREDAEQKQLKAIQDQIEATGQLTQAQLEQQKQQALGTAKSQTERDEIEADFERRKAGASGATADQKYQAQRTSLEEENAAERNRAQDIRAQMEDDKAKLDALRQRASAAADRAESEGAVPDAAGKYDGAIKDQEKIASAAQADLEHAQKSNYSRDQLNVIQENAATQARVLAHFKEAQDLQEQLKKDGGDLDKRIEENSTELNKLTDKLDQFTNALALLETRYKTDKATEDAKAQAQADAAKNKKLEDDANTRKASRNLDIQNLENLLDLMDEKNPQRGDIGKQIGQKKADQIEDDKAVAIATGKVAAGSPEANLYDARAQGERNKAEGKADHAAGEASLRSLRDSLQSARQAAEAFDKQHPELAKHLERIAKGVEGMGSVIGKTNEVAGQIADNAEAQHKALWSAVSALQQKVNQQGHGNSSQMSGLSTP